MRHVEPADAAGDHDHRDHEREHHEVAERIGEVGRHGGERPFVLATTPSTSAAPSAALASAQTRPSSHSEEPSRGARARNSSTSPT